MLDDEQKLCKYTGCSLEDLSVAMDDKDESARARERERETGKSEPVARHDGNLLRPYERGTQ